MTIVMLHPVGLDGQSFQFLDDQLLASSISYDMLWHGDRPEPAEQPTLELFADDVVSNTEGPLDLVGVSLGGSVAQYVALRHPDRVRSLMLAGSTAGDGSAERLHDQQERAAMTIREGMEGMVDWAISRWFTDSARGTTAHPAITYVRQRLLADDPRSFAAGWLALGHSDTIGRLGEIHVPATIVHPDQDVSSLEAKEAMTKQLPCARTVILEGPHMIHLEEPEAFSRAILDHLAWVETVSSARD